jgi:hypothetical protein
VSLRRLIGTFLTKCIYTVWLSFFVVTNASTHVHGQGQLFIVQESSTWQFQFVLPALDFVGFEHNATTEKEKNTLLDFKTKSQQINHFVRLPNTCTLVKSEHSLISDATSEQPKKKHKDIELYYKFMCTTELHVIQLTVFDWAKKLKSMQVEWILRERQGARVVTAGTPLLRF